MLCGMILQNSVLYVTSNRGSTMVKAHKKKLSLLLMFSKCAGARKHSAVGLILIVSVIEFWLQLRKEIWGFGGHYWVLKISPTVHYMPPSASFLLNSLDNK